MERLRYGCGDSTIDIELPRMSVKKGLRRLDNPTTNRFFFASMLILP
jgi:hypothetical protein